MKHRARYREAAEYLGIPYGTLRAKVSRKEIPHYRLSDRLVLFDLDELDEWMRTKLVAGGERGRVA